MCRRQTQNLLVCLSEKKFKKHWSTQQNRSIRFGSKTAITYINKAKAFNEQFSNITLYSTNKINRHIDHTIKALPTEEIQLITTQVQLAISNTTNNNSTESNGINIRHLKYLGSLAIRYLTNMYNIALNTNTIPHLWKRATIILIPKPNKNHNIGKNYRSTSLLSPIAKTLGKTLFTYITENIPIISHQHGFKHKHWAHTLLCTTSATKSQKVSTIEGLHNAL